MADPTSGPPFMSLLVISSVCGIMVSLTMLSLVMIGGPIMVNVVATLKDVLLTYAGFVLMDSEQDYSIPLLAGLALSFAGAAYSLKYKIKLVH